jgi:hypothetical protein
MRWRYSWVRSLSYKERGRAAYVRSRNARRRDEFEDSQRRLKVTKEEWSLRPTPMGSMVIARFETDGIEGAFAGLAESTEAFDVWFSQRVQKITGVDLSAPMEGPPPEIILGWSS